MAGRILLPVDPAAQAPVPDSESEDDLKLNAERDADEGLDQPALEDQALGS